MPITPKGFKDSSKGPTINAPDRILKGAEKLHKNRWTEKGKIVEVPAVFTKFEDIVINSYMADVETSVKGWLESPAGERYIELVKEHEAKETRDKKSKARNEYLNEYSADEAYAADAIFADDKLFSVNYDHGQYQGTGAVFGDGYPEDVHTAALHGGDFRHAQPAYPYMYGAPVEASSQVFLVVLVGLVLAGIMLLCAGCTFMTCCVGGFFLGQGARQPKALQVGDEEEQEEDIV